MKSNAFNRYKYSGDLYKYVTVNKGETITQEYFFAKRIPLKASLQLNGSLMLKAEQKIEVGSLVSNIKDGDGNSILGDQVWETTGLEPIVNSFSAIEEYRIRAIKFAGILN